MKMNSTLLEFNYLVSKASSGIKTRIALCCLLWLQRRTDKDLSYSNGSRSTFGRVQMLISLQSTNINFSLLPFLGGGGGGGCSRLITSPCCPCVYVSVSNFEPFNDRF